MDGGDGDQPGGRFRQLNQKKEKSGFYHRMSQAGTPGPLRTYNMVIFSSCSTLASLKTDRLPVIVVLPKRDDYDAAAF